MPNGLYLDESPQRESGRSGGKSMPIKRGPKNETANCQAAVRRRRQIEKGMLKVAENNCI
jgi:hypothetical protein